MGADLNGALDNLDYTMLLKRPRWFRAHWRDDAVLDDHLRLVQKLMLGPDRLDLWERRMVVRALADIGLRGHDPAVGADPKFVLRRLRSLRTRRRRQDRHGQGWGWKKPNSHLVLHRVMALWPKSKYVHVIRHGFDMAFSENQRQTLNWAPLFGLDDAAGAMGPTTGPTRAFRYWVAANRRVMELGAKLGPERVMAMRFEDLCAEPKRMSRRFVTFLGNTVDERSLDRMAAIPKAPESIGRHRHEDLGIFDDTDRADLAQFGY